MLRPKDIRRNIKKLRFTLMNLRKTAHHHYGSSPLSIIKFLCYSGIRINTFIIYENDLTEELDSHSMDPDIEVGFIISFIVPPQFYCTVIGLSLKPSRCLGAIGHKRRNQASRNSWNYCWTNNHTLFWYIWLIRRWVWLRIVRLPTTRILGWISLPTRGLRTLPPCTSWSY